MHLPAPKYVQRKLDHNREGLSEIYKVADNILRTGCDVNIDEAVKGHDANLLKLLNRTRERKLKSDR